MRKTRFGIRAAVLVVAAALAMLLIPGAANAEDLGDCNLNLDWPHSSVHNGSHFASSSGVIKCRYKHDKLEVHATLFHVCNCGDIVSYDGLRSVQSRANYASSAGVADNCIVGDVYYAMADFAITDGGVTTTRHHDTPSVTMAKCI